MSKPKAFNGLLSVFLSIVLVVGFMPAFSQRAHADELQAAPGAALESQATVTVKMVGNLSLAKGKTRTITIDQVNDNDKVWYSADTSIATVTNSNGKGIVTGKKAGKVIVYVHCRTLDKRYGVYLTVKGPKKIALSHKKLTIAKGKKATLKLKNATASKVTWSSKNKKVATVTKKGVVKAKRAGKAKIIAKYKGKKYTCTVTVKNVKKIALNHKSVKITVGKSAKLKLKNAKASKVKWTSKNKRIATVTKKGVVKAKGAGTTKVVAKYKGKKYVCKVTVKAKKVSVKMKAGTKTVIVKKGKKAVIGTIAKDGYQLTIPAGALSKKTKVKVTSKGTRIDITAVGRKAVRLNKMATLKIALSDKVSLSDVDNWWGVYSFDGETHYLKPNLKKLRQGVLQYQISCFSQSGGHLGAQSASGLAAQGKKSWYESWFGGKKLSDKEMRKMVAYRDAVNEISKDSQNDAVQKLVEKCFGEAAEKLGYKAGTSGYDKIMTQLGKSSDLMALVRSARSGDEAGFTGKASEMLTKVIIENADSTKVGYLGAAVGSIPGVLQDVKKGDYASASTRVAKAVASNIPYVKAVQFTAAVTEITIDYYVDEETEAAYKAYYGQLKNGDYGYSKASDVAWGLVSKQMAAPLRQMEIRAIQAYADAHNVSVNSLSEAEKDKVRDTVKNTLIKQWNYRAAHDAKIEKRQNETLELLRWFCEVGLMDRGDDSVDFSTYDDYQQRLANLLHVRDAIAAMMEGKTFSEISGVGENWLGSKQAVKDYNNENMAKLVLMWVKNGWGKGKNPVNGRLAVAKHLAYNYGMGVSLSSRELSLQVDETSKLTLKGTYGKVSWSSSKEAVAKVSDKGEVTAVKAGTATIYASYGKKSYECKVTVKKKQPRTVYVSGSQTIEFETGGGNGIIVRRVGAGYNDSLEEGWYLGVNKSGTQKVSVTFDHPTKGLTKYVFTLVGKPYTPEPGSSVIFAITSATFNLETEAWEK